MKTILAEDGYIYLDTSDKEENILWEEFSFEDPNSRHYKNTGGRSWLGKVRKFDRFNGRIKDTFLSRLAKVCKKHKIPVEFEDHRKEWCGIVPKKEDVTKDLLPGITLEQYQVDSIKKSITSDHGIFRLVTGLGKTEIICGIAKIFSDVPIIILADISVVVSQLKDRLGIREVDSEIGLFFAGERPNGQRVVCGSIQSLNPPKALRPRPSSGDYKDEKGHKAAIKRWEASKKAYITRKANCAKLSEYVKNAKILIVDECDRSGSKTYKHVIRKVYPQSGIRKKIYGFSATPFDDLKPIRNVEIEENFGGIIADVGREIGEERGRIIPIEYRVLEISRDGYNIQNKIVIDEAITLFITENPNFLNYYLSICRKHAGQKIITLIDRIAVGQVLEKLLKDNGIKARFVSGSTKKSDRKEVITAYENGNVDVLIGSTILERGFDVKGGMNALILAGTAKMKSNFLQKIGRSTRLNFSEEGKSIVYDFYYTCNKYLSDHSKARIKAIAEVGYESKILFPGCDPITCQEFMDRRWMKPAKKKIKKSGKRK